MILRGEELSSLWQKPLVCENFESPYAWHNRSKLLQDAQKGCPARPQPMKAPQAYPLGYV